MVSKAVARFIRISPRKTRLVADYVRGKGVGEAMAILSNLNKKACAYIEDLLRSAIANAKRDPEIKDEDLYISKLTVDGGPTLKRFRAASMGRASMIHHRLSHITMELDKTQSARGRENVPPPPAKKRRILPKKRSAK